jgi:hypothetical protein
MDITREFIAPIVVGLFIGLVTAYLFTKYGKVNDYVATIFGINNNVLLNAIIIIVIIGSIVTLSGMSVVIHDYEYIVENPLKFFVEILAMGILPTLAILVLYYLRGNNISKKDMVGLGLVGVKFMILHILLQLSGYYRPIFQ